ncbi:uncharacterized protein LOC124437753 [Xenia sp. Carnegie-2017]|uniref:uncharacterized protein LOC124437753 n=1 Tax=Xenia sp. Carnegie-2017 TaxID=2897299 RepID=UPI001F039D47|nr:uncharacterized protein LOC124437753 [Xenia sp. Carnegie-2017]
MVVKRLEEEKVLLNMEMRNYMIYYLENVLPLLCEGKEKTKDRIVFTNNVDESNDYSFLETESFLLDEYKHRYCVRKDTMKTLHGRLAITNSGIALARVQLKKDFQYFHDLEQSIVNVYGSDNESDCSDEDDVREDDVHEDVEEEDAYNS